MEIERLLRDALFITDINIRFGNYYYRKLLDKYNGDIVLALAAYNAGFGAVDKAEKNIENLPKETRDFVKRTRKTEKVYITLYPDELLVSKENYEKEHLNFFELLTVVYHKIPINNRK